MRFFLALTYLALQVVMIVYGRIVPSAHFHWAPFDIQNEYWVSVEIDGHELSEDQIADRYNERAVGVDPHAIEHLLAVVEQYERTYGRDDDTSVLVRYRINGREMYEWRWPQE